jgi:hypothetical protein
MAYIPKYKPGDKIKLEGEIRVVVDFPDKTGEHQPMYMIAAGCSWFWAWAAVIDGARPGGDPTGPPPVPPGG